MDPLSMSASIVAMLQLAGSLISYLNDVKEASRDRAKLAIETSSIYASLINLRFRVEDSTAADPWFVGIRSLGVENGPLDQFKAELEHLQRKIEPTEGLKKLRQKLTWSFEKQDISALLSRIERLKSLIGMALDNDLFKLSLALQGDLSDVKTTVSHIRNELAEVHILQEDSIRISVNSEQLRIAEWMSPLDFLSTRSDVFSKRQPGTGQWLLESQLFKSWMVNSRHEIGGQEAGSSRELWCPGIPGAGKTILASLVAEHLESVFTDENAAVISIFCNYKDRIEQTAPAMMGSIMKQLLQIKCEVSETCRAFYNFHTKKGTSPSVREYLQLLQVECSSIKRIFIIVDALDEVSDDDGTRGNLLTALRSLPAPVSFMVTSRPLASIKNDFADSETLEILAKDEDIRKYIVGRVSRETRLSRHVKTDPALLETMMDTIVQAAKGMFLLAQLHLDAIVTKNNRRAIYETLKHLPKGYDATYEDAMRRIQGQNADDKELASKVLSWISYAARPLSVKELQNGLAVEPDDVDIQLDALPDEEILLSVCAGLISIERESNTVRLVHYTTQEFFERTRAQLFPGAQFAIASACLTYLHFDTFEEGPCSSDETWHRRSSDYALLSYASSHWGDHIREVGSATFSDRILALYSSESKTTSALQAMKTSSWYNDLCTGYSECFPKDTYALWISAYFGLTTLVKDLLQSGVSSNECIFQEDSALSAAASNGHIDVVRVILDHQAHSTLELSWDQKAFTQAASARREDILRLLIQYKASFPGRLSAKIKPWAAMEQAVIEGDEAIVRLLLEKVDLFDMVKDNRCYPWSALPAAVAEKKEVIAKLLIANGADVRATSSHQSTLYGRTLFSEDYTALQHAAANGMTSFARLLVEKWKELEADDEGLSEKRNQYGESAKTFQACLNGALLEGAANGHIEVVELLVHHGADIESSKMLDRPFEDWSHESKLSDYANPLHLAVRCGHEKMVLKLLQLGADISSADLKRSPLHTAAAHGHRAMAVLLLENGAQRDLPDSKGTLAIEEAAAAGQMQLISVLSNPATGDPQTALGSALNAAVKSGQSQMVITLLGNKLLCLKPEIVNSTFLLAVESSHEESRARWKNMLAEFSEFKINPFEHSRQEEYLNILCYLYRTKGADMRSAYFKYVGGNLPESGEETTTTNVEEGHIRQILNAVKRPDINNTLTEPGYFTPFMYSVLNGGVDRIRWFLTQPDLQLEAREGPSDFTNGRTAFALAADRGHEEIVSLLLQQEGIDFNSRDDRGDTPLALAAGNGRHKVVKLLLAHPKVVADSINLFGETPLSKTTRAVFEKVLTAADIRPGFSMRRPERSWFDSPHSDPERKSKNTGRRHDAVARLLLERLDVDPASEDAFGRLPVTRAAGSWGISGDVFEILLNRGCPDSALLEVAQTVAGNRIRGKEFMEIFLRRNPNFPITEDIMIAAVGGNADEQVITFLLDLDSNLDITEKILQAAASNTNSRGPLKSLLDRNPDLLITVPILEAASTNTSCGDAILKLLLDRIKSNAAETVLVKALDGENAKFSLVAFLIINFANSKISAEAVKNAVLGSSDLQRALIPTLFSHVRQRPDLRNALAEVVIGYFNVSLAEIMLEECEPDIFTEELVNHMASRQSSDMCRMFLERGFPFPITDEIIRNLYSTWRWDDGPTVLKLLLEQRSDVVFSDDIRKSIFGSGRPQVVKMILERVPEEDLDEEVLKSAAMNKEPEVMRIVMDRCNIPYAVYQTSSQEHFGEQLLMGHFPSSQRISDAVITTAAIQGTPETLKMLIGSSGRQVSFSSQTVISAAKQGENKNLEFLLNEYAGPENIGADVLYEAIGEPPGTSSPETIKSLLARNDQFFSIDDEAIQKGVLAAIKVWNPEIMENLFQHKPDLLVTEEMFEEALQKSLPDVFKVLFDRFSLVVFTERHFALAAENIWRKGRKIIRMLLERDTDLKITWNIFLSFVASGDLELVKQHLERDPDFSITEQVLEVSAKSQHKKTMKWLLNKAQIAEIPQGVLLAAASENNQHRFSVMLMLIEEFVELDFTSEIILAAAGWMWSFVLAKMLKKYKQSHTTEAMLIKACECASYGNIEPLLKQKTCEPISEAVLKAAAAKTWRPADAVNELLDFDTPAHVLITNDVLTVAKANEDTKVLEVLLRRKEAYNLPK